MGMVGTAMAYKTVRQGKFYIVKTGRAAQSFCLVPVANSQTCDYQLIDLFVLWCHLSTCWDPSLSIAWTISRTCPKSISSQPEAANTTLRDKIDSTKALNFPAKHIENHCALLRFGGWPCSCSTG